MRSKGKKLNCQSLRCCDLWLPAVTLEARETNMLLDRNRWMRLWRERI